jgi:hypothetical protein
MESDEDSQPGLARSLTLRLRTHQAVTLAWVRQGLGLGGGNEAKEATPSGACACLLAPTCWLDWLKANDVDRQDRTASTLVACRVFPRPSLVQMRK